MTIKQKRISAIEAALTPKEWAIWLADQMRSYPSKEDLMRTIAKGSRQASPFLKPYQGMRQQAEDRYPGDKPEAVRARIIFNKEQRFEYKSLLELIDMANEITETGAKTFGMKAALKLARLETIVLQDAFGRTARKAVQWVEEYKTFDAAEEESRQGMLLELAAYTPLDFGEKWSDSVPILRGVRFRVPSVIEDWIAEVVALSLNTYVHQATVKAIQDQYFAGHPILYKNTEAEMEEVIGTLEGAVETFNHYLKTRAALFEDEWKTDEEENDGVATAIPGEREGRLAINLDTVRADAKRNIKERAAQWVKVAKNQAKSDILDETNEGASFSWECFQKNFGVKP
jgi:hypothetical protein